MSAFKICHFHIIEVLIAPSDLSVCFCQDFTEDVNVAFEYLLNLTPLLDKADQRCKYVAATHTFVSYVLKHR